jgi:hypothetical protein
MSDEQTVGVPKADLERLADAYGFWLFGPPHGSSPRDAMEACLESVLEYAGLIDRVRSHQREKK